ncbi:MAG: TIGR03435 family protein [Terriglobia bacterium]
MGRSRADGATTRPTHKQECLCNSGLSIFTAIQEQLGLKLESTKGPVDILVIDHIERPSEH